MKPFATHETPLVFVYLGDTFPEYARRSVEIARRTAGTPVVVIAEAPRPLGVSPEIQWWPIESFYSGERFAAFSLSKRFSREFRDGFWLKTAERFFVLEAFMRWTKLETIFHGELDGLFFDLPGVEAEVVQDGRRGVFIPRETDDRSVALLVYVNNRQVLDFLCDYIVNNSSSGNEMEILGAITEGEEKGVYSLPTAEFLYRVAPEASWPVAPRTPSFVVDGAVIGRWIFGVDPRNTGGRGTKNRLQNHKYGVPWELPLSALSFKLVSGPDWNLQVSGPSGVVARVAAVHVHSKVHRKIDERYVSRVVARLARGKSTVIVPLEMRFPLDIGLRIARQLGLTIRSPRKITAAIGNLRSHEWWAGLAERLTRL